MKREGNFLTLVLETENTVSRHAVIKKKKK